MSTEPEPFADPNEWPEIADLRERKLVESLYMAATVPDEKGHIDTVAAKFLLVNNWPKRWSLAPHPTKPSALEVDGGEGTVDGEEDQPIADAPPFKPRLIG